MKLKVTQRDKVLLYIVALVLIVFIGLRYFINPAKEKLEGLIETESNTQMEYDIAKITTGRLSSLQQSKVQLEAQLQELRAGMLAPIYENEKIEWFIDDFVGVTGLSYKSMTISSTQPETLHPFGQDTGTEVSHVSKVEVTTEGSLKKQFNLIDSFREDKNVTVLSFNISDDGESTQMITVLEVLMY